MQTVLAITLIALGLLFVLVGGIWGLVVAFRRSVAWGLACLFVPFAAWIFLIVAWADAKKSFYVSLVGVLLMGSVLLLPNPAGGAFDKLLAMQSNAKLESKELDEAVPDAVVVVSKEQQLAELIEREKSLRARKAALNPQDVAAARQLTDEIAKYNADLKAINEPGGGAKANAAAVVSYNQGNP